MSTTWWDISCCSSSSLSSNVVLEREKRVEDARESRYDKKRPVLVRVVGFMTSVPSEGCDCHGRNNYRTKYYLI